MTETGFLIFMGILLLLVVIVVVVVVASSVAGTAAAIEEGEHFSFAPVDTMIRDNLWICPITPKYQNDAYYSITKNEIIVPEKEQFKSGESFYGTLFHEMTYPNFYIIPTNRAIA